MGNTRQLYCNAAPWAGCSQEVQSRIIVEPGIQRASSSCSVLTPLSPPLSKPGEISVHLVISQGSIIMIVIMVNGRVGLVLAGVSVKQKKSPTLDTIYMH